MMPDVTTADSGSVVRRFAGRAEAELWLDDLRWHKQMFRQSRFQWTGEHVMDILTRATGGQLDFRTVRHLRLLQSYQDEIRDYSAQCQAAMGEALQDAQRTVGSWRVVADVVGLSVADCTLSASLAARTAAAERSNCDVKRVLRQLPFTNPLIRAWELKQLWRLYEAARDAFEDTICDLVVELAAASPEAELEQALGRLSMKPLDRARWARRERGEAGDPRREPRQLF